MFDQFDEEMKKRDIEGVVVYGDSTLGNPDLTYVTGGTIVRGAVFFKRVGEEPFAIVGREDLDSAKKHRRLNRFLTYSEVGMEELTMKYGIAERFPRLLTNVLTENKIKGKVILSGRNDVTNGLQIADQLRQMGFEIVGEKTPTLLETLRETKNTQEIEELRRIGKKTCKIVEAIIEILSDSKRKRGQLILKGKPASIGAVKTIISQKLLAEGLMEPEGTIFAQGAKAIPVHNMGDPDAKLKEGKLIIFDIFPQAQSSYWCDVTRSFVIGHADSKAKRIYEAVYEAQTGTLDYLHEGITGEEATSKTCDIIEKHGYHTERDLYTGKARTVNSGFTHSLGHGVGLTIGETPQLTFGNHKPLKTGNVVTVEPGVYIPGYGGVRIEDTVLITSRGIENLTKVEKTLEL